MQYDQNRERGVFLPEDAVARYQKDGVVYLKGAIDPHWIATLREISSRALLKPTARAEWISASDNNGFFLDTGLTARFRSFRQFLLQSHLAEIAGRLMSSSWTALYYDQLLVKLDGEVPTPWHQDSSYWPLQGAKMCAVWVPLDRIGSKQGLQFVVGTHTGPEYNAYHFDSGNGYEGTGLPELPAIESLPAKSIFSQAMSPGDCVYFHAGIIHGAPSSSRRAYRRAIAIKWLGDDVRHKVRFGEEAVLRRHTDIVEGAPLDKKGFPILWKANKKEGSWARNLEGRKRRKNVSRNVLRDQSKED